MQDVSWSTSTRRSVFDDEREIEARGQAGATGGRSPFAEKPPVAKPTGSFRVQVAAFASRAGAEATARKLGGSVSAAGKLWRVRLGPFATRAEAGAAQAKARKAGFADAQVVSGQVVSGK